MTVSGSGSAGNPFVVSADNPDCSVIRACLSAGNGASYSAASGIISARTSTDPNNNVTFGGDGGLYVTTNCAQVRQCFTEGNGIDYDPVTGVIAARPSTDAGNNVTFGGDGGLFVPTGAATVSVQCGLTGDGSAGNPLAAAVAAWSYPCDLGANAGLVYCDPSGNLRSEPRGRATFTQVLIDNAYPSVAVPTVTEATVETRNLQIDNPDLCRPAFVIVEVELDVDLRLPVNGTAMYGMGGDDTVYVENRGNATQNNVHWQTTKAYNRTIPPGGSLVEPFPITMGLGSNGATYQRIQTIERAFIFNL
ncbi:hypothetical protein [Streptomyces sp. NBC_00425]|uniref:hypothetical protein n=1 Tax=Streptomyces sp. NBC_00425 TaxID=2975740 RepID=UPI002E21399A